MNAQVFEKLGRLNEFPVKGAAVIGYYFERGETSGEFCLALVEQSGSKQYTLRWSDNLTEKFKDLQGKNESYQYFCLLGYALKSDYEGYCSKSFWSAEELPPIYDAPCQQSILAHRDQSRAIAKIRKVYEIERSKLPDKIVGGMSIIFIYVNCLRDPKIVEGAFTRMYDGDVYVNYDDNLQATDDEDLYLYVPRKMFLQVGNASKKS